jgi:hypothetical protein
LCILALCYALIAAGKLRCTRHGLGRGCIRISEDQLAAYPVLAEGQEADRQGFKWIH